LLFDFFKKNANQSAILSAEKKFDYSQYYNFILATAQNLSKKGLRSGDRVAILSENCLEYPIVLMALFNIKAVAVPLNHRYPVSQLNAMLDKINCNIVITSKNLRKPDEVENRKVFVLEEVVQFPKIIFGDEDLENDVSLEQDATIIFTSGSSAQPKAVLHTLKNHYYNALGSNLNITISRGNIWLLSLPLFHVGGLAILFRTILSGSAIAIPEKSIALTAAIENVKPTHISLVTTQLYRLLQQDHILKFLSNMKAILLGGSAFPEKLLKMAYQKKLPVIKSYGCTEMASQITATQPGESELDFNSSGKILKFREIKTGLNNEILVRGLSLARGYVVKNKVSPLGDKDGWFRTGDIGNLSEKGNLRILGRKNFMFISGGENIFPEEIERYLSELDEVIEAVVVPLPNKEFGERPVAFIKVKSGEDFKPNIFTEYLKQYLPVFKIPDSYFQWPENAANIGIIPDRKFFIEIAKNASKK
jgi:O-succinylbenzoic acid--CoA ligase